MARNVGGIDRTIRIVLGAVLVLAGIFTTVGLTARVIMVAAGGVALITAFTGF